jgi:hypothetical protein
LGVWQEVNLVEARKKRDDAKMLLKSGKDPLMEKKKRKSNAFQDQGNTFGSISEEWFKRMQDEISKGYGNNLEIVFISKGCNAEEYDYFAKKMEQNYDKNFNKSTYKLVSVEDLVANINNLIDSDPLLNTSCNRYSPVDIVAVR